MHKSVGLIALALAATTALLADSFTITINLTSTDGNATIQSGVYQGSFSTNGACSPCTVSNGGIASFQIPISTGNSVTNPAVLVFNAFDSANRLFAQYSPTTQSFSPIGSMLEQIMSGTGPFVYPITTHLDLTATTVNTPPTACDAMDTVRTGCVSIGIDEGVFAQGTYTIQPVTNPTPTCTAATSNVSNFNGTSITPGGFIWFNSNLQVFGASGKKVQISFKQQTIQFTANQPYSVPVPDAVITLDPAATCASTSFDTSAQTWRTTVPVSGGDEIFLSGVAFPVPAGFAKVDGNVNWQGTMGSDTPSVTMSWKWGAAVYSSFTTDYNAVAPKAAHQNACALNNGDHAGTPEGSLNGVSLKKYVIGGARGGGGSNFTGSWSGTTNVVPVCQP